ncbi:MAG: hypothetical protein Q9193_002825 [Seirophora villosa]
MGTTGSHQPSTNQQSTQRKKYYSGIGSDDDIKIVGRMESGAFGSGLSDQIREVYKSIELKKAIRRLARYTVICKDTAHQDVYGSADVESAGFTRKAPKIQFVGVFDTVKALRDDHLYDTSFNDSIQQLRHALALDENRRAFRPEYEYPDFRHLPLARRSIVQAWFVGAHIDIGGSAAKDGLSLYPLQWMLVESRAKGLQLEFDGSFGNRAVIDDPLKLVFPAYESEGKGVPMSSFTAKNKLKVDMQDLRRVHELPKHGAKYAVHLNQHNRVWIPNEPRAAFSEDGNLRGYCEYAAQGTIIHPSVYLILDVFGTLFLSPKARSVRNRIEGFRDRILTKDVFWEEKDMIDDAKPGAIRILTTASERVRGNHDIKTPLFCENRPDLIIHDSGGFETGGDDEFQKVKEFVAGMSRATEMKDRLHVIWFADQDISSETNSERVQQKAAVDFFTVLTQHSEIPIVVVQTKKDEFWDLQFGKAWRRFRVQAEAEAYANEELQKRVIQIERDLSDIKDSRYDKESIKMLAEETARCFDHEKVRMLYVAAQVARIDLKVDLATTKTMQIYKRVINSAGGTSLIPMATTTSRVTVGAVVCTAVVNAFGVPSVTAATVRQIVKSILWDDMGGNFKVFLAECIATAGVVATVGLFGMPVFLAAGAITAPVAIVATAEMLLMLSCDLILVLRRAFKDCTHQFLGHPLKKNIEKAALAYREFALGVHKEIKILTPNTTKFYQAFQSAKIKIGFEQIIEKYTQSFVEQSDVGSSSRHGSVQRSLESQVSSLDLKKGQSARNPVRWPPVPFQVPLLRRKGHQSIVITRNNGRDYGPDAHDLAKKVCARMTTWITTLPHGSAINEPHWEKESYGEVHAREFTIWMQLVPKDTSGRVKLDRELAYFAMNEYCNLVAVYGAMRGEFEFWGFETVLAVTVIHVIQWPKSKAAGSTA